MRSILRDVRERDDGFAAVEFALIVPVMLLMLFGTYELTNAITAKRRVAIAVSTLADLTTNTTRDYVHEDTVADIMDATAAVLKPYGVDGAVTRLTAVTWKLDDPSDPAAGGKYVVTWSRERSGAGDTEETSKTGYKEGDEFTQFLQTSSLAKDEALVSENYDIVFAEIEYAYAPPVRFYYGTFDLDQSELRVPRYQPRLALCVSNKSGPDCTDGRNWLEAEGRPE